MSVVRIAFFIISGLLFTLLLSVVLFVSLHSGDTDPIVRLETHKGLPASADSDGDGVPNWLEEIKGSDTLNASSFPYNKDIVRARRTVSDDLLYDGPGDFVEEIVQRILLNTDGSPVLTDGESGQFAKESADYYLDVLEDRGVPDVDLEVDNSVSRQDVLNKFVTSVEHFSDQKRPIDVVIFEVFAKESSALKEAQDLRSSCDQALRSIPRKVPADVYDSYYFVLERVVYLCEALTAALAPSSLENLLYIIRLVSVQSASGDDDITDFGQNRFEFMVEDIIQSLKV